MITSLIEMLGLPNFGHCAKYNLSHEIKFFGDVMDRNYDVINLISKYLYFKKT